MLLTNQYLKLHKQKIEPFQSDIIVDGKSWSCDQEVLNSKLHG